MNNDFSARPFAAGTLVGIRSFRATSTGRLTGVYHQHDFMPGENTADCCVRTHSGFSMTICSARDRAPADHRPGTLRCLCGFYAYFDQGHNPHHNAGQILALIEGYGLMSVGERGFRCEKARLVAFIDENAAPPPVVPLKVLLGRWAFKQAARVLRVGVPEWSGSTVPTAVRAAYPGVPVYRGIGEALAAHPLTAPERPREVAS